MNKFNKTAYMFFIWAVFMCCGCGREDTRMYLEAKTQETTVSEQLSGTSADDAARDSDQDADLKEEAATCFVYVCGAVRHPGVYELPQGSRVYEALALAGGLRKDAYEKNLNQAQQIADGQMIEVLTVEEFEEGRQQNMTQQADRQQTDPQQTDLQQTDAHDGRIDLNTATMEQLMTLSGIGEAKAANIIAYRESCGGFSAPEEIMNVSGIGEGVYARIQDKITVIR